MPTKNRVFQLDTLKRDGSEMCSMNTIYALRGQEEGTLEYLNKAIQRHCNSIRTRTLRIYGSLRDDPKFKELMTRVNL